MNNFLVNLKTPDITRSAFLKLHNITFSLKVGSDRFGLVFID